MFRTAIRVGVLVLACAGPAPAGAFNPRAQGEPAPPLFQLVPANQDQGAGPGRLDLIAGLPTYFVPRPGASAEDPTAQARLQLAEQAVRSIAAPDRAGQPVAVEAQLRWSRRLLDAELAAATSRAEQIRAAEAHVARVDRLAADQAERALAELTAPAAPGGPARGITAELEPAWDGRWAEVARLGAAAVQLRRWLEVARRRQPPDHAGGPQDPGDNDDRRDWPDWPRVDARPADDPRQRAILARLESRVAFDFPEPVPLEDFLGFVARATVDPAGGLPEGIPIHPTPTALGEADKTLAAPVALRLDGVPLRTSLRLALGQLGLGYEVAGGLLLLTTEEEESNRLGPRGGAALVREQPGDDRLAAPIRARLEAAVPMRFPEGIPLGDLIEHVRRSTAGLGSGIPIYADPQALQDADKTLASTVQVDLAGLPLRTTLRLALDQLGLTYVIEGGALLVVTTGAAREAQGVRGYAPAIPPNSIFVPAGTVDGPKVMGGSIGGPMMGGGFR